MGNTGFEASPSAEEGGSRMSGCQRRENEGTDTAPFMFQSATMPGFARRLSKAMSVPQRDLASLGHDDASSSQPPSGDHHAAGWPGPQMTEPQDLSFDRDRTLLSLREEREGKEENWQGTEREDQETPAGQWTTDMYRGGLDTAGFKQCDWRSMSSPEFGTCAAECSLASAPEVDARRVGFTVREEMMQRAVDQYQQGHQKHSALASGDAGASIAREEDFPDFLRNSCTTLDPSQDGNSEPGLSCAETSGGASWNCPGADSDDGHRTFLGCSWKEIIPNPVIRARLCSMDLIPSTGSPRHGSPVRYSSFHSALPSEPSVTPWSLEESGPCGTPERETAASSRSASPGSSDSSPVLQRQKTANRRSVLEVCWSTKPQRSRKVDARDELDELGEFDRQEELARFLGDMVPGYKRKRT